MWRHMERGAARGVAPQKAFWGATGSRMERMTKFSLGAAAKAAGVSKTTLRRMVEAGRISAERGEGGAFQIDASELGRFLDSRSAASQPVQPEGENPDEPSSPPAALPGALGELKKRLEVEARASLAEERLKLLSAQLESSEKRAEEWKEEAGAWRAQAERLLIASEIVKTPEPKPGFWRRVFGGGKA